MSLKKLFMMPTLLTALLFATACSVKESNKSADGPQTLNSASYVVMENKALTSTSDTLSGEGSVVFVSPLAEDANNFLLSFELAEGGSLTLVAGSDNKLQEGLSLVFSREDTGLKFVTMAGDKESTSTDLQGIDAANQITLNLDVHNDETPAHVLVWKNDNTSELLVDTEEGAETAGNAQSNLWGLKLKSATVTRADVRAPANEE